MRTHTHTHTHTHMYTLRTQVSSLNGVKIYNCAAGKTVPEWMEEAKKKHKSLRYLTLAVTVHGVLCDV